MNENKIYGYCRISTSKQNIDRQIRNIKNEYPTAIIYQEIFTGTKTLSRKKWQQLLKVVKAGDTIVFDSVSRMSRDADSGIQLYQVTVSLDSSTWTEDKYQGSAPSYGYVYQYYFKMKLQDNNSSSYALALDLTNSLGKTLVPSNNKVAVFRSDGINSDYGDGTITFTRNTKYSTDKKYKEAGTFKGTLNFVIEGSYY